MKKRNPKQQRDLADIAELIKQTPTMSYFKEIEGMKENILACLLGGSIGSFILFAFLLNPFFGGMLASSVVFGLVCVEIIDLEN